MVDVLEPIFTNLLVAQYHQTDVSKLRLTILDVHSKCCVCFVKGTRANTTHFDLEVLFAHPEYVRSLEIYTMKVCKDHFVVGMTVREQISKHLQAFRGNTIQALRKINGTQTIV